MNHVETACLFGLYGLVSVSMTLLNKALVDAFPLLLTTILVQNVGAILCSVLLNYFGLQQLKPLRTSHFIPALLNSIWLLAVIWSSMKALQHVSVPLYVLASNSRPLFTAAIELVWSGVKVPTTRIISIFLIIGGAGLYAFHDASVSHEGLSYAVCYTLLVAGLSVYENKMMNSIKTEQTPLGVNLYRLVLSTFLIFALLGHTEDLTLLMEIPTRTALVLGASSVLCLSIGVVMFYLQERATATSIQVANVCFKLLATVCSLLFFPSHSASVSLQGWFGYVISTVGFVMYSFGNYKQHFDGSVKEAKKRS